MYVFIYLITTNWIKKKKKKWSAVRFGVNNYSAMHSLKHAGLNTAQRWVKYGRTQRLG